jgi:hypothetical protein
VAASGVSRRRAQERCEPRGSAGVKSAIRSPSQPGDLAKSSPGRGILPLLKHERLDAKQRELARQSGERIRVFLHRVADKDQRSDFRALGFIARMGEHPPDLRRPAAHLDAAHELCEPLPA